MILVTSSAPNYAKAWLFPTLGMMPCRVACLLHPEDERPLLTSAERVNFTGTRYYQDGRFLESLAHVHDKETVVLADADAVLQRGPHDGELTPPPDGLALGWNMKPRQAAAEEVYSLGSRCSIDGVARVLGFSMSDMHAAIVYNWGLVAAEARTWRRLTALYRAEMEAWGASLFDNPCYMQLLLCLLLYRHRLPITVLGYGTHSHAHFPPLSSEHSIRERKLYYRDELVFFAHCVPGVTH